jgi:hypothetical protein
VASKRWKPGSKKRLARIRFRGNWPRTLPLVLSFVAIAVMWLAILWASSADQLANGHQ